MIVSWKRRVGRKLYWLVGRVGLFLVYDGFVPSFPPFFASAAQDRQRTFIVYVSLSIHLLYAAITAIGIGMLERERLRVTPPSMTLPGLRIRFGETNEYWVGDVILAWVLH